MSEKQTVGGVPVECLTGESGAIWSGWRMLGDREVVREASAKGTHINLAYKYLAFRRNCSPNEAKNYFNREVELWIQELLNKCQVYRASHILKNMGKNPVEYISNVCIKCQEPVLRDYLVNYMIHSNSFNNEQQKAWSIIQNIAQYEKKHMLENLLSNTLCIEDIINLPGTIKQALSTELYMQFFEPKLLSNVKNDVLWNYLLLHNNINTIRYWIDKKYNTNLKSKTAYKVDDNLKQLLDDFTITTEMIEWIDQSDASDIIKDLTKNHLCRYGIFIKSEKDNLKLTLARIFGSQLALHDFREILSYESCNIDKTTFLENININYYLMQETHTPEIELRIKELYNALNRMCNSQSDILDAIIDAILKNINYVSDNLIDFLKENYLVTFTLIFLQYCKTHDILLQEKENATVESDNFKNIFTNQSGLQIGANIIPYEVLQNTLERIPIVRRIIQNQPKKDDITVYELLDGYKNLNVKQFFKWRFNNEPLPHFSNDNLVKKYGYKETLTYAYYLKEGRPNMALYALKHPQGKSLGNISSRMKRKAAFYAHGFALKNLHNSEITCSCISFLEMLGVSSETLRLHVTAADFVQKNINTSIGHLLESAMFKNQDSLQTIIKHLENSFQLYLNDNITSEATVFFDALKTWEFIVQFARTHDCFLPDTLFKYLAQQNLWFEFVLAGHIFAYPTSQILPLVKEFPNVTLREHMLTCLDNSQLKTSTHSKYEKKLKSRDVRQSLYCKIGLKQNESPSSSASSSLTDTSSCDTYSIALEKISPIDNIFSSDDDFWMTFLKCHQSQDPPGALLHVSRITLRPFLIILATCYEPSLTATYCYSWMVISTANKSILSDYAECLDQITWPASKVLELIPRLVSSGYVCTISRAFQIFMPDSVLKPFFEFLLQCINFGEFTECQQYLKNFKIQCSTLICSKIVNWECIDDTYLNNLYWIATLTIKCIVMALAYSFQSTQLQIHFLNCLLKCNFHDGLPVEVPNLQNLVNITKILLKTDITLNFSAFTDMDNVYSYNDEIRRCIDRLVILKDYTNALQICNIAAMDASEIIVAQYRNEFECNVSTKTKLDKSFWKWCTDDFKKYNVPSEKIAEFLVEHAEKVLSHKERYEILKFAFQTLKDSQIEQQTIDTLEMAMWKSCILIGPNNVLLEYDEEILQKLKTELIAELNKLQITCILTDSNEEKAAEELIDKLIDAGKLDLALRISTIFNYTHKDLQVLILCLSLAEGELLCTELTLQQKSFLFNDDKSVPQKYSILKNRGLQRLSSSSSSLNTVGVESCKTSDVRNSPIRQQQVECLSVIEKLIKTLHHGINTGSRIFLCYKLSMRTGKSYQSLIKLNEPMQLLQEVTESNIDNKFETASDIIMAYRIKSDKIASFLTKNIVDSITKAIENKQDDSITMWGCPLDSTFHLIMELCSDISILGSHLLDTAHKLMGQSQGEKRNVSTLKTIVELLIRSHDCFTTCCNMEGIASILRKCQNIANALQHHKYWTLLVRLITGVGRFTEMNYIFQILKENDQFEFLLGKGLHKVPGLKTALLEFLKRNCLENKELFTLVALHFRLYYEIALMWENEAKEIMNDLTSELMKDGKVASTQAELKLIRGESVQQKLQTIMTNFTHATQYYLQDNKLHLANRCCQQARLVALQISLLGTTSNQYTCIMNLKSDQVDKILCEKLTFPQALIVTNAYNHHPDWANIIYSHYILNGETKYLKDFSTIIKLSSNLVEDCARRYRSEKSITHTMKNNMKTLISELADIECKYMLASQLGFKEIVETMLGTPDIAAYLKDTVWKKGYKAS